jgi:hypothetical protein
MPGLPSRPDLDQLRRQARELLRAAVAGEPAAITRMCAVSPELTLSAAQLALAREYGFGSWPALRAEAQTRRLTALAESEPPAGGAEPGPPPAFGNRWSFGGAGAIETLTGVLHVEGLIAGPDVEGLAPGPKRAGLLARLLPWDSGPGRAAPAGHGGSPDDFAEGLNGMEALSRFGDIAVVDDRGTPYTLRRCGTSHPPSLAWIDFEFRVDPVPGPDTRWLELSGQGGTTTRLLPSARVAARIGEVTPVTGNPAERDLHRRARSVLAQWLCAPVGSRDYTTRNACASLLSAMAQARRAGTLETASELPDQVARLCATLIGQGPADGLPAPWAGMLAAADQGDGSRCHLDIDPALPPVAGVTIRLDALIGAPGSWRLHLRSVGRWPVEVRRDGNGNLTEKWRSTEISADDDRGNSYIGSFGSSFSKDGIIEQSSLTFRPRLDPLTRRLRLTVTGPADQATIDLELGPAAGQRVN